MTPEALCAEGAKTDAWASIWREADEYRREALAEHGGTDSAICAGFLFLSSGDWLDLSSGGGIRGTDHRAVVGSALLHERETFTDRDGRTDALRRWMLRACAIRLHASCDYSRQGTDAYAALDLTDLHLPLVWGLMDCRGLLAMQQVDPANASRIREWIEKGRVSILKWLKQLQPTEVSFILPGGMYDNPTLDSVVVEMNPWSASEFLAGSNRSLPPAWR